MGFVIGGVGLRAFWFLVFSISLCGALRREAMVTQKKLEVRKHLDRLNKPAVKSIESPDGDIIDCVHIHHQPAFDHPHFKNHTIQMRPSYHPEGLFKDEKLSTLKDVNDEPNPIPHQLWHLSGRCPEGTIPIRRTKEDDLLRVSSTFKRYGKKKLKSVPKPSSADPDLITQNGHQWLACNSLCKWRRILWRKSHHKRVGASNPATQRVQLVSDLDSRRRF